MHIRLTLLTYIALIAIIMTGCVRSVQPNNFSKLQVGMPEPEVLEILGPPASTGLEADGTTVHEYREYRYSWTSGAREQVAVYAVRCKDGKLIAYGKSEGANFRPHSSTTVITR